MKKKAIDAATSRMLEDAWGIDTSTLTKSELKSKLISNGCVMKNRVNPQGDFKSNDSKQRLTELLHSKLQVPPPHVSVAAFLADVQLRAQDEGDAAVLAMACHTPNQTTTSTGPFYLSHTRLHTHACAYILAHWHIDTLTY